MQVPQQGNAEAAFDKLIADIDANPLVVSSDRTPVTQGVAYTAIAQAMYSDFYWPQLEAALKSAQLGDGSGLLSLYDQYFQRQDDGTYGNRARSVPLDLVSRRSGLDERRRK